MNLMKTYEVESIAEAIADAEVGGKDVEPGYRLGFKYGFIAAWNFFKKLESNKHFAEEMSSSSEECRGNVVRKG